MPTDFGQRASRKVKMEMAHATMVVKEDSTGSLSLPVGLKAAYDLKEAVVVLEDIKGRPVERGECLNVFGSIYTKPSYACDKCGKKFGDSLKLKCHSMVHKLKMSAPKKKQNLKCYICVKQFSDRNSLWSHMRVHSARQMAQTCKLCRKSFKSAQALTLHASSCPNSNAGQVTNAKPKCCVCMRECANVDELRSHRLLHKKERAPKEEDDQPIASAENDSQPIATEKVEATPPQFKCCHQIFQSFDLLCVHMYHKFSVHQESRCLPQYVCSICSTTFNGRSDWCQHSTKRHGCDETTLSRWEQSLTCDRCEQIFTDSIKVMQHKLADCKGEEAADEPRFETVYNVGTKPALRTYSRKAAKDPAGVKRKSDDSDVITIDESDDEIDTAFICKLCPFTSAEFRLLEEHCINAHKIPLRVKEEPLSDSSPAKRNRTGRIWNCKKCSEKFDTSRRLREHRKLHRKDDNVAQYNYKYDDKKGVFICFTCDAEWETKDKIESHVLEHEEKFVCDICSETFVKPYEYSTHLFNHDQSKGFGCPFCKYTTPRRTAIMIHINTYHLRKYIYTCTLCGKGFNDCVLFKEHHNVHQGIKPFRCVVCGKEFAFSSYLTSHQVRNHQVTIDGMIGTNQCCVCSKRFTRQNSLEKHMRQHVVIGEKKVFEKKHLCDICGKGFSRTEKLRIHYRVHTGVKPYACSYCDKSFTKRDYMIMHERVHSGEKPYSCQYCGKCFNQGAPLRLHVRSHTGERPQPGHTCPVCQKTYTSNGVLRAHKSRMHKAKPRYPCETCGKLFRYRGEAKKHESVHRTGERFECDLCQKSFKHKPLLRAHFRFLHGGDCKYKCEECGKVCISKTSLSVHQSRAHMDVTQECPDCHKVYKDKVWFKKHRRTHQPDYAPRTWSCQLCSSTLSSEQSFRTHMKSHSKDQQLICDTCGKRITSLESFKNHLRIHSGEKPFKCSHCDKTFSAKKFLVVHERVHTKEKPYCCDLCPKRFSQRSTLGIHLRLHTGERPYPCTICDKSFVSKTSLNSHFRTHKRLNTE
ncbi:zinc finger protein 234-like [Photinus pyralis]|uniref:zinc finger protein 234-like n=1 Tax=Photinus pyralis TaxID=7054 RepID=UPI001266FBB5|nr:zinc finger protein 234-like [Photinus pyralis]